MIFMPPHRLSIKEDYRQRAVAQMAPGGVGLGLGEGSIPFHDVIACDVINPDHIDVEFESIGGLEKIKEALIELVILPLLRPELFAHGKLLGPQKGVLLYGPPGTGKTMLAKAIAKESRAVFINLRISNLMSKWFGDAQKLEDLLVILLASWLGSCQNWINGLYQKLMDLLEASIRNGDLQGFQLFVKHFPSITRRKHTHLKGHQGVSNEERTKEPMNLPSAEQQSKDEIPWWGVPKNPLEDPEHLNGGWDDEERRKH
ncbi:hypothetical protein L1049_022767 [Liquidambar formosana]|uniref:ATPase AAA-type core domain-containing protein n=1 Tax=Liquidambar formosana TaxID=63359 RepID=A0AAP0WS23_LIQFO